MRDAEFTKVCGWCSVGRSAVGNTCGTMSNAGVPFRGLSSVLLVLEVRDVGAVFLHCSFSNHLRPHEGRRVSDELTLLLRLQLLSWLTLRPHEGRRVHQNLRRLQLFGASS